MIRNVTKQIGKVLVIDGINIEINPGEIVGLLGPNGAGKTTLMKLIVGLSKKSKGQILINDYNIDTEFELAMNNVGALIEHPMFYEQLSGLNNLIYYSNMLQEKITNADIINLLKEVGLYENKDMKVRKYSLGMKQRLGIAKALLGNPKLVILDEPTNGLDPMGIKELREFLKRYTKDDNSVIISSHLLSEIELLCDKVAIINDGRLIEFFDVNSNSKSEIFDVQINTDNNKMLIPLIKDYIYNFELIETEKLILKNVYKDDIPMILKKILNNNIPVYECTLLKDSLEKRFTKVINSEVNDEKI